MAQKTFTNNGVKFNQTTVVTQVLELVHDPSFMSESCYDFESQKQYFMSKKSLDEAAATKIALQHVIEGAFERVMGHGAHCPAEKLDLSAITTPSEISEELITTALAKLRAARVKNVHRNYTNSRRSF